MITPITIRAKIFMQQLWQESIDWDEPLNETLTENWQKIVDNLQAALMTTTIPRRYHLNSNSKTVAQLHCFVDSSIEAYGAVTYLKHGHEISFVMAKTRVAPITKLTLPQLELMAALIGTRLLSFIHNAMNSRYDTLEVYLWSDSQSFYIGSTATSSLNSSSPIVLTQLKSSFLPALGIIVLHMKTLQIFLLVVSLFSKCNPHRYGKTVQLGLRYLKNIGLLGQQQQPF
jgi:hypothetical protein